MNLHANAQLSLRKREKIVELRLGGRSLAATAEAVAASERTVGKWWRRFLAEGEAGLLDRSSRPRRQPTRTPAERVDAIRRLRGLRMSGPEIAELLGMPVATVSGVLRREGLGRLGRLGLEPARTFEVSRPGEVVHLDCKKLGRFAGGAGHRITGRRGRTKHHRLGWEVVHIAIDGHSRLAYAEVLPDEKASTTLGFLKRMRSFYARYGIEIERLHTDNGSNYRSGAFAMALRLAGLKHSRSRAYRPQTNGKAERFIRTMLDGWAYGAIYASSAERARALDGWLWTYNHRRPHASLARATPASTLLR